ncbi:ATP phosphoribosyltransferase regulatory subunit [Kouleothrix sp.]|uniref:ATP phosphoribosyltransferase regulatory subunit n=1 Tax=Kouleothrix sp. TaxID=2779161 RepID=UPI00391CC94B
MSNSTTIDPVRGMRDVPPAELAPQLAVSARLEQALASYGYQPIDLPIIEQRDLYGRKLGEELVGKVYEFSFNGRELALRPEWTASVLRAYVGKLQGQPLPLRLRYAGPVFRNERPQRATYRQFTQVGVELIGGPAPRADAECLALACAGLDAAGVEGYRVRVGHIGLVRQVLRSLGLAERTQGLLAWSLERMRERGVDAVRERLDAAQSPLPFDAALLAGLSDAQAEALLLGSLGAIGVNLEFGTRAPAAIVGRLVRKLRRADPQPQIERALALLERLCAIQAAPAAAFEQAEALLREFDLPTALLSELRAIVDLLGAHRLPADRIALDFGLGRGLHYYTGLIFEIYDADELQLCGGGRYDDLVTALGGRQPTPAVGFAYGLERVVAAARPAAPPRTPELLVSAADDTAYPYALHVAQALRARGYIAAADVRARSAAANQRDGARRGVAALVLVSAADAATEELLWRDLATRAERRVALADVPPAGESL